MDWIGWAVVLFLVCLMVVGIVGGIVYLIIRAVRGPRRKGRRSAS